MIKMETFELLRKHFAMSGITLSNGKYPFNAKNSIIFVSLCITVSLSAISMKDAKTDDERTDILFQSVSIGICCIVYVIIIWKTTILFDFIDGLDDTINESESRVIHFNLDKRNFNLYFMLGWEHSESRTIYLESSQKVEKLIQISHVTFLKITPFLTMIPGSIVSFITYFVTDLGGSAFKLPLPMW